MTLYPAAEQVPWLYSGPNGGPTYFKGQNRPEAVVLHVQQGYARTARQWALSGHYGASWHFTVAKDGSVMQHLDFRDGGYHAGIPATAPDPTWPLWKGHGRNVNTYTIGVEHEGFSGEVFPAAQAAASRELCRWLAAELGVPYDRERFPSHADIDLINRPNDFHPPAMRDDFYRYLFEEDEMTPAQLAMLEACYAALCAGDADSINRWNDNGNSLIAGFTIDQQKLLEHIDNHPVSSALADHLHEVAFSPYYTSPPVKKP